MAIPLRIPAGMVCFVLAICTFAQDATGERLPESAHDDLIEEIIVTGTRIARRDFDTPSPLTTISLADIEFTPIPTLEETLNQLPQVTPGYGRASNNPGDGTATVNLRHLGTGRSLVLLNGRRLQATGTGSTVNLNNVPRFLVERVEIITGGASAVYGSDAIAGVVNLITRRNFQGLEFEAGIAMTERGDAETHDFNFACGYDFANGKGNISLYAGLLERESLLAGEREFTNVQYVDVDGVLYEAGSFRTPEGVVVWPLADFGDGPAQATFNPDGTPRTFDYLEDAYNYQPVNYLQIPLDRRTVGAMGHYDLAGGLEGYFEVGFTRSKPSLNLAPVPAHLYLGVNLDNPVLTPEARRLFADHYTCGENLACMLFSKRLSELGPRIKNYELDYRRIVAGLNADLADGWKLDAWIIYADASELRVSRNDASRSRFQQGLLIDPLTGECYDPSGGCAPLNVFGAGNLSPEAVEFIRYPDYENVLERTHKSASVLVTGALFDTQAGPMSMAMGAEWRSDDTWFQADDNLATGDALGFGSQAGVDGTEAVAELYAETLVPLANDRRWAEQLDLEVGARYSMHDHAENVWTWKAGWSWKINSSVLVRTMYQRSARAPNSTELFQERQHAERWWIRFDPTDDPCSASADPVGNQNAEKCLMQGLAADQLGLFEATPFYPVTRYWGGNPELAPEVGKTWTMGGIFSPTTWPDWTFSIDYYRLKVTDTIGAIDSGSICFDPVNTSHVFCENLRRDASGNVAQMHNLTNNRGVMETTGIDTQIHFHTELPAAVSIRGHIATLDLGVYWTHLLSVEEQENPVTQVLGCAGYFGPVCIWSSYPANRVTTNTYYASGPFEAHLTWRWIDSMKNAALLPPGAQGAPAANPAIRKVSSRNYLDLGLAYAFGSRYRVQLSIGNLLDTGPPQMAEYAFDNNTDQGLYDVFGRSYRLALYAKF